MSERDRRMVDALRRAGDVMLASRDPQEVLQNIVDAALVAVPAMRWAGVNRRGGRGGRRLGPVAGTDAALVALARRQDELDQGACVDALGGTTVVAQEPDEIARRWPSMATEYARVGVASLVTFPLLGANRAPGGTLGLYADRAGAIDEETLVVGELFAGQAAITLLGSDRAASLERAIETRDLIGQAKGVLMERHHLDPDTAFSLLVRTSQEANEKLTDVALSTVRGAGATPQDRARTDSTTR